VSRHALVAALVLAGSLAGSLAGLLAGCGADLSAEGGHRTLHVYAASSLTAAFTELEEDFESSHPGVDVELVLGGSSDLAAQIDQGAPADVFASADEATMTRLVDAGLATGDPQPFATNTLQIAVPPDNPAGVRTLRDLEEGSVQLVTCASEVPCGAAAQALAERAGVSLRSVSEEQSVTDVLNKVSTGEADAGLVYVTDVAAAGDDVRGIAVPESTEVVNLYPVVTLAESEQQALAQDFVDLVLGEQGQDVLRQLGFGPP
jgi:molybdate transport system substrate-binding protein